MESDATEGFRDVHNLAKRVKVSFVEPHRLSFASEEDAKVMAMLEKLIKAEHVATVPGSVTREMLVAAFKGIPGALDGKA